MGVRVLSAYAAPLGLRVGDRGGGTLGEFVHECRAKLVCRAGGLYDPLKELVGVVDGDIHEPPAQAWPPPPTLSR